MSTEPKKLNRSTSNKFIAGVCGGLGEYFGVDPTVVRIIFVLFGLAGGASLLLYLVLWVMIKEA